MVSLVRLIVTIKTIPYTWAGLVIGKPSSTKETAKSTGLSEKLDKKQESKGFNTVGKEKI